MQPSAMEPDEIDNDEVAICPKCGSLVRVTIVPDEKEDGTILGYPEATCPKCRHQLTQEEIDF